jgi:hypothetical protein
MIAALYVMPDGPYAGLPDVDVWDEARDARTYPGPHAVVAHPPCGRWSSLARLNEFRWGAKVGDDGGCFAAALAAVREFGGVLEHPAGSLAWAEFGLVRPVRGAWVRDIFGAGWATEVSQSAYGHRARKRTWLYACVDTPPVLDWSNPAGEAWVSWADSDRYPDVARLSKREAKATPAPFRDLLLSIARSV